MGNHALGVFVLGFVCCCLYISAALCYSSRGDIPPSFSATIITATGAFIAYATAKPPRKGE